MSGETCCPIFGKSKLLSKKALPTITDVLRHIRHIRFWKFELENIRLGAEDISLESEKYKHSL